MTDDLHITLIRTSCLLLECGGVRVLTDPWFENHMRGLPVYRKPGVSLDELPKIDVIAISHLHRDHFHKKAVERLRHGGMMVLGPVGTAKRCRNMRRLEVRELSVWQETVAAGVHFIATPALHTGPPPDEINFVIKLGPWRLFFGGDCRFGPAFAQIAARVEQIDVALLPIGGTLIFGRRTTMAPEDAVRASSILKPRWAVPIHEGGEWMSLPPASRHPGRFVDFANQLAARQPEISARVLTPGVRSSFGQEELRR